MASCLLDSYAPFCSTQLSLGCPAYHWLHFQNFLAVRLGHVAGFKLKAYEYKWCILLKRLTPRNPPMLCALVSFLLPGMVGIPTEALKGVKGKPLPDRLPDMPECLHRGGLLCRSAYSLGNLTWARNPFLMSLIAYFYLYIFDSSRVGHEWATELNWAYPKSWLTFSFSMWTCWGTVDM